jgi:L-fucose isomerase-like protein
MGTAGGLWPTPKLSFQNEIRVYEAQFAKFGVEMADVDFVVDAIVTSVEAVNRIKPRLQNVDGILVIHLSMGTGAILSEILSAGKPTTLFALPYSGHEWVGFGGLQKQPIGAKLECFLTSDYSQLATAIRPFRAIHHAREAKILNVTTRSFQDYADRMKAKFGTEMKQVDLDTVVKAYEAIDDRDAEAETERWMKGARDVIEPSRKEVFKSCKLALAFENMLAAEDATVLTVDCYGTMWDKTIKLPAYPCIGFCRLNDLGLGGICESDLRCAMTHIILQGLTGKPGFISDPTVDESTGSIILAHCLGSSRMDGPSGPQAPYKIRNVMERQEGVTPQIEMRIGQPVTQAILVGDDTMLQFTGQIIDAPVGVEHDRGCRTKITVKVDGDITTLWKNWSQGLHRQTVYGNIRKELGQFCRYTGIRLIDEAATDTHLA